MENLSLELYSQNTGTIVLIFNHFPLYSGLTNQEQNVIAVTYLLREIENTHLLFTYL